MSSYCLKCKRNIESINGKKMILSKCAICGSKKSKVTKKQKAKVILTSLGFKKGLEKIPFIGDYLL